MEFTPYRTTGKIIAVKTFGALVELTDTKEVGILHISKISERFISDVSKFLTPGTVIRVDVTNKKDDRVELSILDIPHYQNIDANGSEDFELLAEHLPQWIEEKKRSYQK